MNTLSKQNKNITFFGKTLLATTMLTAAGLATFATSAKAMDNLTTPDGEQVVGGSATFDRPADGVLNIDQSTDRVIINWDHFNIGKDAKTEFFQPGSGSLAVNRVTGGNTDPTQILGTLIANGRVMVIDRSGVFFGADSHVDVGSIIVSTGDVSDSSIMSGDNKFEFSDFGPGKIELNGTVSVADAGLAAFVSPFVSNSGIINAKLGKVAFAGGDKVTLDLYGDDLIEIAVNDKASDALLKNSGTINAEGGTVIMTAQAAKNAVDDVVNMGGTINASSATQQGGKIILSGGEQGVVRVSGKLDASGQGGGEVSVTGQNILVNGTVDANGGDNGNGGHVRVFADDQAIFTGRINARGGLFGGDGGFVETSAVNYLDAEGNVDASATNGAAGVWLLDPKNLEVVNGAAGANANLDQNGPALFRSSGGVPGASTVTNGSIQQSLNAGTSVELRTHNSGAEDGDITVNAAIQKTAGGDATLLLASHNDIIINQDISSTAGKLSVDLEAGQGDTAHVSNAVDNIAVNANISTNGGSFSANSNLVANGFAANQGTFSTGGDYVINTKGGAVNIVAGSDIALDGDILTGGGSATFTGGSFTLDDPGADIIDTDGGNVTINAGYTRVSGTIDVSNGASGGNIQINNTGIFTATKPANATSVDNLITAGTGTITLNQNAGGKIQEAIDAVKNTGTGLNTVNVGAGTYDENVLVDQSNTLIRSFDGRATTIVNGQTGGLLGTFVVGNGINNVQIGETDHGFTINGFDNGNPAVENAAVYFQGAHDTAKLQGNTIVANGDEAILTEYGQANNKITIDGNTITGNTFTGADGAWGTGGDQFVTPNTPRQLVALNFGNSNVTFSNNEVTGNAGDRQLVAIESNGNNTVNNNNFDGLSYASALRIRGTNFDVNSNVIDGNGRGYGIESDKNGVNLTIGSATDTKGNVIHNTGRDGINIQNATGNNLIINNKIGYTDITGNTSAGTNNIVGDGIDIENTNGIKIQKNKITETDWNGEWDNGSSIQVQHSNNVTIGGPDAADGNILSNSGWDYIRVDADGTADNFLIANNTGSGGAERVGIWFRGMTNSTVDHNNISKTTRYGGIVADGGAHLSITNNTVDQTDESGILMTGTQGINLVDGNTITNTGLAPKNDGDGSNSTDGIRIVNAQGLADSGDSGTDPDAFTTVSNNKVGVTGAAGNIKGNGISIIDSPYTLIKTNTVSNVLGDGLFVDPSPATIVIGNSFTGGIFGVEVTGDSDNSVIKGNTISGQVTNGAGIYIHNNTDNATIGGTGVGDGNTITEGADTWGIYVDGGNTQNVIGNTVNGSNVGIRLINTGAGAQVKGNTVGQTTGTSSDGIELVSTGTATVSGNHVYNAGWDGINVNSNTGAVTVSGNDIHNTVGASGIAYVGGSTAGGLIDQNTIENSARLGIYSDRTQNLTITGNTITNSGTGNINGPFGPFTDAIFIEGGSNVTIGDLTTASKGNKIDGATGAGIRVGGGGNYAPVSTSTIVIGNNKIQNVGADGIHVQDSAGVKIASNKVGYEFDGTTSAGTDNIKGDGIFVTNSDGAKIQKNVITETSSTAWDKGSGIQVTNSDDVFIGGPNGSDGNKITNAGWDYIRVDYEGGTLNNLTIQNNDGHNNGAADGAERVGIYAEGLTNSLIDKNKISETNRYAGIYTTGGHDDKITNNTVKNIDEVGILMTGTTGSNLVDNNTITKTGLQKKNDGDSSNSGDGIKIVNSGGTSGAFTTISHNHVGDGTANGINGDGIGVYDSAYTVISANTVQNVAGNGTFIDPSDHSVIKGNTYNNVALNGIYSLGNDDITIGGANSSDGNKITNAGLNGIFVDDTGHSTYSGKIQNNKISVVGTASASDGIRLISGQNFLIDKNSVTGEDGSGNTNGRAGASRDGIHVESDNGVVVSNNTVTGGTGASIVLSGTPGNGGAGAANDGIYVKNSNNANINHNTVSGGLTSPSGHFIVDFFGGNGGNGANNNGIEVSGGTDALVDTNTITGGLLGNAQGAHNDGIHVDGNQQAKITNNKILGNLAFAGAEGAGHDGINVNNSGAKNTNGKNGVVVTGNTVLGFVSNGAGNDGIHVVNSANKGNASAVALIGDNSVTIVGHDGIFASKTDRVHTVNNTVTKTGDDGIEIDDSDNANTEHNTVTSAGDVGVLIDPSNNTVTDSNIVTLSGSYGIQVDGGTNNTVSHNTVSLSGDDGVRIDHNAGSSVLGNTITLSDGDGVEVNGGVNLFILTLGSNTVDGNNISLSNGNGVNFHDNPLGTITNNTITASDLNGILVDNVQGLDVGKNTVTISALDGIHVTDSLAANIHENKVSASLGNGIFLDGSAAAHIDDNTVTLSGLDGIFANNVLGLTIDGNGVSLSGDDGIDARNIVSGEINKNTVTISAHDGIALRDAAAVDIIENDVSLSGGNGIFVDPSVGIDVSNNIVTLSLLDGIHVEDVLGLTVNDNNVSLSGDDGIDVDGVVGFTVNNNTVTGSLDNGIELSNAAAGTVDGNTITISGADGINADGLAAVGIDGNTISVSLDDGIDVNGAAIFSADGNIITGSLNNGIELSNAAGGTVNNNIVSLSGNDGIHAEDLALVGIDNNVVSGSLHDGIFVDPSAGVTVNGNIITLSGNDGIHIEDVLGLEVNNNVVSLSGDDGIDADGVALFTIDGNIVTGSLNNGIELSDAAGGTVDGNVVTLSGHDGINAAGILGVGIDHNIVTGSLHDGIDVTGAALFSVNNNLVSLSGHDGIQLLGAAGGTVDGNFVDLSGNDGIHATGLLGVGIDHNFVIGSLDDGIDVNGAALFTVDGNVVSLSGSNGIELTNAAGGLVGGNAVFFSGHDGIHADHIAGVGIDGNFVRFAGDDGIGVRNAVFSQINDNNVRFAGDNGIELKDSNFIQIDGNAVRNADNAGIFVDPSSWITISHNNLSHNDVGVYLEDASNIFVLNNNIHNNRVYGLDAAGNHNGYIEVTGNTFTNNPVGAHFQSGIIDLTHVDPVLGYGNKFLGGDIALEFDVNGGRGGGSTTQLSLVRTGGVGYTYDGTGYDTFNGTTVFPPSHFGGTIGSQYFEGQSKAFVVVGDNTFVDPPGTTNAVWLDGRDSTYYRPGFGAFTPGTVPGGISASQQAFLESMFYHYPDAVNRGIFFFGFVPSPTVNIAQEDIFNKFNPFNAGIGGLNITLLGLPSIPGGGTPPSGFSTAALNAISTFAGGDSNGTFSPDELNAIETAAGGGTNADGTPGNGPAHVNCWSDAANTAYSGQTVNYSYATDSDSAVAGAAACSAPPL